MNHILKLGLTLMLVAVIAGAALSLTNRFTLVQIENQKQNAIKESLNIVIQAESFEEKEGYYEALDKDKKVIGKVLKVNTPGYSSTIQALVGIDLENKITGIDIVSQQETPGLGAKIEGEGFLSQFKGKTSTDIKLRKDSGKIDAVTGATISSRAISNGVKASMEQYGFAAQTDDITGASKPANNTAAKNMTAIPNTITRVNNSAAKKAMPSSIGANNATR
ncbi:MAG TPA: RnfABCDGE type electron transport complex subunit G [Candidatus Nanoarchaeia archaeon]|nr:RnfABCDGE type electron transport complex subunit G [Candidatus Nanoarchaeia archaeon]